MLDGDRAAAAAGELPSSAAGFDRPDAGEVAGNGQPDRTAGPGLVGAGAVERITPSRTSDPPTSSRITPPPCCPGLFWYRLPPPPASDGLVTLPKVEPGYAPAYWAAQSV